MSCLKGPIFPKYSLIIGPLDFLELVLSHENHRLKAQVVSNEYSFCGGMIALTTQIGVLPTFHLIIHSRAKVKIKIDSTVQGSFHPF